MLSKYKLQDFSFERNVSYVYILYMGYEIVYIGMTRRLYERLFTHYREKKFSHAKYIIVSHSEAPKLERALIKHYKPAYNTTHKDDVAEKTKVKAVNKLRTLDDHIKYYRDNKPSLQELLNTASRFDITLKSLSEKIKATQ